ncbi:translin-associated factor X-interacting protein 1-like isoform X2 [Liolophura sinensis]|uniref:translin-associated factor X-interacting protein 1-like isoform X2 n=1 Tax=Liolophura sinensis TaxID=3198878 RepID=UPI0031582471
MERQPLALAKLPPIEGQQNLLSHHGDVQKFEGLTGPSYLLQSNKYQLPPPRALKPYVDTRAGELDTWPAHASGNATSSKAVVLTKNKNLVVISDEELGKPQMVPKPRFLEQLETFLKKELRALGVTNVEANELRLQAHREAFEYLIEDFKTYKPLLAAIKNEYEMMLASQRQHIRELEPLKQMLVTVSEQCDQKIMALHEEEKQEVKDLRAENKSLYRKIEEMRNQQKDLEEQVSKLHNELAAEYQRYRDECDARKLLVADINDLRYQQEDYQMSKKNLQQLEEEHEDPLTLKIALRKAREDEKAATQRLNEMVADYGDVIPRRDFEALESKYNKLVEEQETSLDDFRKLQAEHNALLDVNKQIVQQRDEFYVESEKLRRNATPRPDWDRCADYVQGGVMRWKELSEGKTSNELVDVLLQEMASGGVGDGGGAEYFDGQGTGPEVPPYLRCEGHVRNRRLGKRDCALLIKDIWREKSAQDAESPDGKRSSLAEFLYTYLTRKFGLEQMVVEWGYNLHDALQRYSHDESLGLFWGVLTGEVDEEVYHSQLQIMANLVNHLTKVDVEKGNPGKLSREEFQQVLKEFFPQIPEDRLTRLMKAVDIELETKEADELEYKNLFMEDDEGKTGPFLEEVKKYTDDQKEEYVDNIISALGDVTSVSVDDLKKAIATTDPEIDQRNMDKYILWTFKCEPDKLGSAEPLKISVVKERLKKGDLHRIGKRA